MLFTLDRDRMLYPYATRFRPVSSLAPRKWCCFCGAKGDTESRRKSQRECHLAPFPRVAQRLLRNSSHNFRADKFRQPDGKFLPDSNDLVKLATVRANVTDIAIAKTILPDSRIRFCSPLLLKPECAAVARTATKIECLLSTFDAALSNSASTTAYCRPCD